MSAELLADALYQQKQAARRLESIEGQYRQFIVKTFPHRRGRETNPKNREQYEWDLAGHRKVYEDARQALQELDWLVEALEGNDHGV